MSGSHTKTHENYSQAAERVSPLSSALLLEPEAAVWSSPASRPAMGKDTEAVCSRRLSLRRIGQKAITLEPSLAFVGDRTSLTDQLVPFLRGH